MCVPYLTYSEYKKYGGIVEETAFPAYVIQGDSYLDYITNNRIAKLTEIPEVAKVLETKIINTIYSSDTIIFSKNGHGVISSYSNGIESFSYDNSQLTEEALKIKFTNLAKTLLAGYPCLLCRKVRCDERCCNYSK